MNEMATMFLKGILSSIFLLFFALDSLGIDSSWAASTTLAPKATTPLDCDFEEGFCHWTQANNGTYFKWELSTGLLFDKHAKKDKPPHDHTLENAMGHYMFASKSTVYSYHPLKLVSPYVFVPQNGICFKFWYYMYGVGVSPMNVYVVPKTKTVNHNKDEPGRRIVWTVSGTKGVEWNFAQIHIQNITGEYFLTMETEFETRQYNAASLDDFSMNYGPCLASNTLCDFEEDQFCHYEQSKKDDFDWSVSSSSSSSSSPTNQRLPKHDHTYETSDGHYAFLDASKPRKSGDKAVIESSPFPATSTSCVHFWYFMNGTSMGTLNARIKPSSTSREKIFDDKKILWTKSGDQGGDWFLGSFTVSSSVNYKIVFEGIVGDGVQSNMAIDDISVKRGHCPDYGSCDFEEHDCSWRNVEGDDDLDWERTAGHHSSKVTIPKVDHTLNTPFGHYLFSDSYRQNYKREVKYVSPPLDKGKKYCLNLWYFKIARRKNDFTVVPQDLITKHMYHSVASIQGVGTNAWESIRQTVGPYSKEFDIVLIGTANSLYSASFAIDDLSIQEGSCDTTPSPNPVKNAFSCSNGEFRPRRDICNFHKDCPNGEEETMCGYDCTFEDGNMCGWQAQNWKIQSGATSNGNKGPRLDSTSNTETGRYLYLQTEYRQGTFVSPVFQMSAPSCEFVFSLYYTNSTRPSFFLKKSIGVDDILLLQPGTNFGAKWRRIIVPLGASKVPFRIEMSTSLVYYKKTDNVEIAVDDIHFRNCDYPQPKASCTKENTFKCSNGACVHPVNVCNNVDDCGDGSDETNQTCLTYHECDFESGLCDWSQETNDDDFDWKMTSADKTRIRTSPKVDHTTYFSYGHYLFVYSKTSGTLPGDKARLLSPVLEATQSCVFTLYLHSYGQDDGQFSVYIRSEIGGDLTQLFNQKGQIGNFWSPVNLHIKSLTKFQIVLEGALGSRTNDQTMAVDDIKLSPTCKISTDSLPVSTQPIPHTTPSPCGDITKWQCADGTQCIYKIELCDFVAQCSDESDEKDCGACDFESSSCGWHDKTRGAFIWDRVNTSSENVVYKPKTDHTHGGQRVGSYMLAHTRGYGYGRPVVLESPILGSTEADCSIRFYYQNFLGRYLQLYVYHKDVTSYESNENLIQLWRGYKIRRWTKVTASIGARLHGFRLVFRFSLSNWRSNDKRALETISAIDDISFSSSCGMGKQTRFCSIGEFRCVSSKECKPMSVRCDLARDCKNGEDEEDCEKFTMMDFEPGFEQFTVDIQNSNFYWKIQQPSSSADMFAPDRDHTLGNETGHYLYIEKQESKSAYDGISRLKGPVMYRTIEGSCIMRLFYHLTGDYTNALSVYTETREGGLLDHKWSVSKGEGDEWKKAEIVLIEKTLFRVIIEGVRVGNYKGDIGIDDVSFTPQCRQSPGVSLPASIPIPRAGPCKVGLEFACDGKCLSAKKVCDFKVDCKDKSDELMCPSKCDFESGMCGWVNEASSDSVEWVVSAASSVGGGADHKPGRLNGHIARIAQIKSGYRPHASLVSPLFRASSHNCSFSFWVKEIGSRADLQLNLRTTNVDKLWRQARSQSMREWSQVSVTLPPCRENFQLEIYYTSYKSSIPVYLDDLSFDGCGLVLDSPVEECKPGEFQCSNGLCVAEDKICDLNNDCCDESDEDVTMCYSYTRYTFESGMAGWKQITGIKSWTLVKAIPHVDHTFSSTDGHYLYENCRYVVSSAMAHEMPAPIEKCVIRFWYRFERKMNANITVFITPISGESINVKTFSSSLESSDSWVRGEVDIDTKERYDLILESGCNSKHYNYYYSHISIDDFVFSPGCNLRPLPPQPHTTAVTTQRNTISCPNMEGFSCDGACISGSKVCDFNVDCVDKSDENECHTISTCDFDVDLCGWQESEPDSLDWVRVSLSDHEADNRRPIFDASGTGESYAYVQKIDNSDSKKQIAYLQSKNFSSSAADCAVEFYYFLNGTSPGTLRLGMSYGFDQFGVLWETNRKSDSWVKAIVWIGLKTSTFSLYFTRVLSDITYDGQMGIDKIHFASSCKELPAHNQSNSCNNTDTEFMCHRGACILKSQICNGQDDCGDNSDESKKLCKNYITEDFESASSSSPLPTSASRQNNHLLIQSTGEGDNLDWLIWNNSQRIPPGLLGVDHSIGLPDGHYLYVRGNPPVGASDSAWLVSKPFHATAGKPGCQVRFFALIPESLQSIQVSQRPYQSVNTTAPFRDAKVTIFGSFWQQVTFTFDDVSYPFQVVIKGSPIDGALAIDDVTFGPYCKLYDKPKDPVTDNKNNQDKENGSDGDSGGEWKSAVGVVGSLVCVAGLSGTAYYLHKTGRLGGIQSRFRRFGERTYSPSRPDGSNSKSVSNSVYYDGNNKEVHY